MTSGLKGIIGGVGPRASLAFMQSVYSEWEGQVEQLTPRLILYSDPLLIDRTLAYQ